MMQNTNPNIGIMPDKGQKERYKKSEAVRELERAVERAGGLYWLVRSFEEFKQMYDTL